MLPQQTWLPTSLKDGLIRTQEYGRLLERSRNFIQDVKGRYLLGSYSETPATSAFIQETLSSVTVHQR